MLAWLRLMASNRIICGAYRRAGTQDLINWFGFELADRAAGCGVAGGGMYKEKKEKEKVLLHRSLSSAACLTSQSLSLFLFLQIYASGLNLYLS